MITGHTNTFETEETADEGDGLFRTTVIATEGSERPYLCITEIFTGALSGVGPRNATASYLVSPILCKEGELGEDRWPLMYRLQLAHPVKN